MDRLRGLTEALCPNGVEYYSLKDLCRVKNKEAVTKNDLIDGGKYPVINSSREIFGYCSRYNNKGDTLVLTSHGYAAGFCHYMQEPFFAGALCYPMQSFDTSVITTKYLYYLLQNSEKYIREHFVNRSGVPYLNFKALMLYQLPLPPLPVQHEIVRILDIFTSLTTELATELATELTARKRQYAYYRDRLLTFGKKVPRVKLGEVSKITKGVQFNKTDMGNFGTYPVINGGVNPSGYIERYNQKENTVTVSQGGASAGFVNWLHTKFWAGAHCYVIKGEKYVTDKYLYHCIKSKEYKLRACQYGAGIPALSKSTIEELDIPLPPLSDQKHLAAILDRFDALCNDLIDGIPAEIAVRKKQYAYYRDKLLDFKRLN